MGESVSIGEAARLLGVSVSTLRRWDRANYFKPTARTAGRHRRYAVSAIRQRRGEAEPEVRGGLCLGYARVSSSEQKEDLMRQEAELEAACAAINPKYEVISDLGSGINYKKKGLQKLIRLILAGHVGTLVLTHRDRLLRFGSQLLFQICDFHQVRIKVLHEQTDLAFETQLAMDVVEIITVFTSRVYGRRAQENRRRRLAG